MATHSRVEGSDTHADVWRFRMEMWGPAGILLSGAGMYWVVALHLVLAANALPLMILVMADTVLVVWLFYAATQWLLRRSSMQKWLAGLLLATFGFHAWLWGVAGSSLDARVVFSEPAVSAAIYTHFMAASWYSSLAAIVALAVVVIRADEPAQSIGKS